MAIKKKVTVIVEIGDMKIQQSTSDDAWFGDNPLYFASESARAAGDVTGQICTMIAGLHGDVRDREDRK